MSDQKAWSMKRVVAASSAGTAFEWYDFFIFGSLATTIQKVFFTGLDPTAGLVAALGHCSLPALPFVPSAPSSSG